MDNPLRPQLVEHKLVMERALEGLPDYPNIPENPNISISDVLHFHGFSHFGS